MQKVAGVPGGGGGAGRATALGLLGGGWGVALVGRREAALRETAEQAADAGERALVLPCDIGDQAAVEQMAGQVFARFGRVDALVNAAGTNTPARSLAELSPEHYQIGRAHV